MWTMSAFSSATIAASTCGDGAPTRPRPAGSCQELRVRPGQEPLRANRLPDRCAVLAT